MFRISGILMLLLAVFLGSLLFWTSQSVQKSEKKYTQVLQSVHSEEDALRVLSTEWSYLNRPDRLEKLAVENLSLGKGAGKSNSIVQEAKKIPEPIAPAIPTIKPIRFISLERGQE